jgi:hypothetical protein
MIRFMLFSWALAIASCATASETYTPTGQGGYAIDCSGAALTWNACDQKAGEICSSHGYSVISISFNERTVTRSIIVQCNT